MLGQLAHFPDNESIDYLRTLTVRYIVVHRHFFRDSKTYMDLVSRMAARRELLGRGEYSDSVDTAVLFELTP